MAQRNESLANTEWDDNHQESLTARLRQLRACRIKAVEIIGFMEDARKSPRHRWSDLSIAYARVVDLTRELQSISVPDSELDPGFPVGLRWHHEVQGGTQYIQLIEHDGDGRPIDPSLDRSVVRTRDFAFVLFCGIARACDRHQNETNSRGIVSMLRSVGCFFVRDFNLSFNTERVRDVIHELDSALDRCETLIDQVACRTRTIRA